jgi:putative ABC transport system substrate-binding protein
MMHRREFVGLLGGAAAAPSVLWPLAARGQQAPRTVVGFLHSGSAAPYAARLTSFRQGIADGGLVEGRDFTIEFRWAEGSYDRLRQMARDLVDRNVAVIVAGGGVVSAPVAKAATSTIPIVFVTGADPVATGLTTSIARPDANATGVSMLTQALLAKRLGLLNLLAPDAVEVPVLFNPNNPSKDLAIKELQTAASASKRRIHLFEARTEREIDAAFEAMIQRRLGTALVVSDPFFTSRHAQIAALGSRMAVPVMYPSREYVEAGGLVSYGADIRDEYRKTGAYVARILRGAKVVDLPIIQPTKFELVLNLKTARAIGLRISDSFQLLADEVIE